MPGKKEVLVSKPKNIKLKLLDSLVFWVWGGQRENGERFIGKQKSKHHRKNAEFDKESSF